jgi:PKD repeat protein
VGDSVAFADSSSGPVVSRAWIFGDGATSDLARPRHAYTTVGTFVVRLTVRGVADSSVAVDTIHVAPVPVRARIWLASRQLTVGDSVAFADSSSGPVASRTWTFGDGGSSSLASGRHRYTSSGTFVVGLTVRGVADSSLAADTVKVSPVPVRAKFGQSALQVLTNASVTFTDSSTGPILSRTWAFGDGGTSTQTSPSHSYTAAGTYTVVLTVRGATDSSQATGTMKVVAGLVTLKLAAEFNLVSWPIDTPNDSVEAIIRPILSDVIQVQGFETANIKPSGGGTGAKVYTPTGGLYNTLKKTDHRLGYWIRMRAARTLQITGVPVYADTVAVPLAANFNLVGYLPSFGDSVRFAVTSLSGKLVQVQGFQTSQWPIAPFKHTSTGAKIYTPTGGLYNTLKFMSPQCGYWVKLTAVDTLIWQRAAGPGVPATPAARLLASAGEEAGPFAAEPVTPTSRWVVVYGQVLAADGQPAGAGTVVDVVDATGNVAGWFQVEQPGVYGYLPVYLDDPTSPLDEGAEVGEWLTLRVNGVATETRVQWTQDSELIQINLVAPPTPTAVVGALPPGFALHPVYPNPFNPSATIRYDLAKAEFVHLKLYSLTGQLVRELVSAWQPAGSYEVRWDGLDGDRRAVANGTYLCQLETPSDRAVRRMVLMK